MSWKAEVQANGSGSWASNGLRFATNAEAHAYGIELMLCWKSVKDFRTTRTLDPVTHRWIGRRALSLELAEKNG